MRRNENSLADPLKEILLICSTLAWLFFGCSVDRLAILLRQYHSGDLMTEKPENLERKFASAKEQFISAPGKDLLVCYLEGLTCEKRKDYPAALSAFAKTTEMDPDFLDAWLHIAQIHSLLDQKKEAQTSYRVCLAIIDKEISYIDRQQWPDDHILCDDHWKYAIRYSLIDNSYFPEKPDGENKYEFDFAEIRKTLLKLRSRIENSLSAEQRQ